MSDNKQIPPHWSLELKQPTAAEGKTRRKLSLESTLCLGKAVGCYFKSRKGQFLELSSPRK